MIRELIHAMDFSVYNKQYFEGGGDSNYSSYKQCEPILLELGRILVQLTPGSKSYLDVGCAYGFTIGYLTNAGFDAMGVDPSPYAIEYARTQSWSDKIVEDSLPKLEKVDRTFDTVFSSAVIEHVPEEEISDSLIRMFELTKKHLIITTIIGLPGHEDHDKTHVSVKPASWWTKTIWFVGMAAYRDLELEERFNAIPYCKQMGWSNHVMAFTK